MLIKSEKNGHILEHDEEGHLYLLDGKPLDGVTSILSVGYPKSQGLVSWQIKEGVKWALENKDKLPLEEILKQAPTAHKEALDTAADIGTTVHDYAYHTEKGLPFTIPDDEIVKKCCEQFDEWRLTNQDEIIALEELVCSVSLKYAGRFDRLSNRQGIVTLSDYKTSSNFFITQFVQMAAYAIAIEEWMGIEVQDIEIIRFDKKTGKLSTRNLQQLADTVDLKPATCMKRLKSAFASILEVYKFKNKFDKYIRK